jgi:hypothetical protein
VHGTELVLLLALAVPVLVGTVLTGWSYVRMALAR